MIRTTTPPYNIYYVPFLSPLLSLMETPSTNKWIRLTPTLMVPLPSLRGYLPLTTNTQTITPTCCNLTPPPLERQGERAGKAGGKVDQLSERATYEICYGLSLLPPLPSKPNRLAPATRRFQPSSDLASPHDSASFSTFRRGVLRERFTFNLLRVLT